MRETIEREVKLRPGDAFRLPELGGEPLPTRVFVSTYHDTVDLRLARHGVTLRHRIEDGAGLWQLKLPRGAARTELEVPGPPARPPLELLALLPAYLRGRELVPVARLRTRREGVRAQGAEIVDDNVAVLEGQRVSRRFRELEVELLEGDERTLRRLEQELRRAGAESAESQRPKLYRALDLAGPLRRRAAAAGDTPLEALGIALEEQYLHMLAHDPGTRRGDDPEDLHQLRVATRRLRAYLRCARGLVERGWAEHLREELGWLGGALGPARDLDVMLDRFRAEVSALGVEGLGAAGLVETLERERAGAYASVVEALTGERYVGLLDLLERGSAPPAGSKSTPLAKIWRREARRMCRTFASLGGEPADGDLHASRIAVKRARYAADLAAHELGAAGAAFVSRAKALQDVLGAHQDAVVAEERIRSWAEASGRSAEPAAARLSELERERRAAARAAWPEAWARLERAARKAGA